MLDPRSSARVVALTPFQQVSAQLKEALRENVELKAQIAVLTAAASAAAVPAGKAEYPPEFEAAWQAYPPREGRNKKTSFKAWAARVKAKVSPVVILAGVERYAVYIAAERKEERYTLQPATFFGPDEHYLLPWNPSRVTTPAGRPGKFDPVAHVNRGAAPPRGCDDGVIDVTPR